MTDLRGARVLVTGATGFIGGRLIERLAGLEGAHVRALVRTLSGAPRIARFPVEIAAGDVLSPDSVDRAVAGCEVIVHCAYGSQGEDADRRTVNVDGTRHVLAAARRHRCRRVVCVSTMSVYGDPPHGDIDERAARRYTGSAYGDSKVDAERLALGYASQGLSVAIVQPTVVYGPFGTTWTVKPLQQYRTGRLVLVNGGDGLCNAVFVDDVVSGLIAAASAERAHGEAFLISGPEPVTWREFFGRYSRMLGGGATVSMSAEEARAHWEAAQPRGVMADTVRVLRREAARRDQLIRSRLSSSVVGRAGLGLAERLEFLPREGAPPAEAPSAEAPIHPLHPSKVPMFASKARVRTDKAARLLGYRPLFDLDRGMALTEAWARWANLI